MVSKEILLSLLFVLLLSPSVNGEFGDEIQAAASIIESLKFHQRADNYFCTVLHQNLASSHLKQLVKIIYFCCPLLQSFLFLEPEFVTA